MMGSSVGLFLASLLSQGILMHIAKGTSSSQPPQTIPVRETEARDLVLPRVMQKGAAGKKSVMTHAEISQNQAFIAVPDAGATLAVTAS